MEASVLKEMSRLTCRGNNNESGYSFGEAVPEAEALYLYRLSAEITVNCLKNYLK